MSILTGKEALIALANGEEVQGTMGGEWTDISIEQKLSIKSFTTGKNDFGDAVFFRLKPSTITLNGFEVPTPFEPKDGDIYFIVHPAMINGYTEVRFRDGDYHKGLTQFGAWRTEEEIKQVVAALRQVFGGVR